MVISPRSKIVTLSLLIGILTLVALIITGVIGIWHKSEKPTKQGTKVVSSKLQQITGYTATKHVSRNFLFTADHTRLGHCFTVGRSCFNRDLLNMVVYQCGDIYQFSMLTCQTKCF